MTSSNLDFNFFQKGSQGIRHVKECFLSVTPRCNQFLIKAALWLMSTLLNNLTATGTLLSLPLTTKYQLILALPSSFDFLKSTTINQKSWDQKCGLLTHGSKVNIFHPHTSAQSINEDSNFAD